MSVRLSGVRLRLAEFTLSLDVEFSSAVTGVFGASGAGKTSLLELIAGIRRPEAGVISIHGEPVADVAARKFLRPEHRSVGYVPQDLGLFPHLTVRQNLLYGWHSRQVRAGTPSLGQVAEVLEVAPFYERSVGALSGGEKRRVALGRALLASPRLLLLDEPLSGLDEPLQAQILPYLASVRKAFNIPMIYVSHEPSEMINLCDEIVVLSRGALARRGEAREVFVAAPEPRYILRRSDEAAGAAKFPVALPGEAGEGPASP